MNNEPVRIATRNADGSFTITWEEKETPMSADIDAEEHGTAAEWFDVDAGWDDTTIKDVIELEFGGDRESTHYPGCWVRHHACALAEILRLRGYIRKLEGEVVGVHEEVEGHEELVQEVKDLNVTLEHRRNRLEELCDRLTQVTSSRDEYKFLYMNAFAAVKAIAKLLPEPKG